MAVLGPSLLASAGTRALSHSRVGSQKNCGRACRPISGICGALGDHGTADLVAEEMGSEGRFPQKAGARMGSEYGSFWRCGNICGVLLGHQAGLCRYD